MRNIISLLIIIGLLLIGSYVLLDQNDYFVEESLDESGFELPKLKSNQMEKNTFDLLKGDLFTFINTSSNELTDKIGEPIRKDITPYGYTWWLYTDETSEYIQFGVQDGKVKTIYGAGENISSAPFSIGANYDEINKQFPFTREVTYRDGLSFYSHILDENDLQEQPLIKLSNELFVQCYFDTFTNELSSIRILTGDMLLKHYFYELEYRGTLPEKENHSKEVWKKIEVGVEKQIFDLTNIFRLRHNLNPLIKDPLLNEVAYAHSEDMFIKQYFSHYRPDGTGLQERLSEKSVFYLAAGENIAAQHADGPAATEGWINSEGHREALLNEEYTHLGVGVHELYYTQNFLLKP